MYQGTVKQIFKNIPEDILTRKNNQILPIIREVWKKPGVSRQELSKILEISKVAVSKNIDRLISMNIIIEGKGKPGKSGRNPIALNIKRKLFYSVGIKIVNDYSQLLVQDSSRKEIRRIEIEHPDLNALDSCNLIIKALDKVLSDKNLPVSSFAGIGISIAGLLDVDKGVVLSTQTFPNDTNIPLADYFSKHYERQCFLINNANLMAIGEHWYGKGQNMNSFLYFSMGYGLGMILNGNLYDGHQHNAGEVGFMQIQERGEQSPDGRHGNLNMIKPFYRILPRIREIVKTEGHTTIGDMAAGQNGKIDWNLVIKAVCAKDKLCMQLLTETFEAIARGIVNLAYIFNPEAIFFEPWTGQCREVTLDIIDRMMVHYGIHNVQLSTEILPAAHGSDDLAWHAGIIPIKALFAQDN
jgi:N-acetylglucosamine repressor